MSGTNEEVWVFSQQDQLISPSPMRPDRNCRLHEMRGFFFFDWLRNCHLLRKDSTTCSYLNVNPALGTSRPPLKWVMGTSPGIERSDYEADHISASSSEVKSEQRVSYILPYAFVVCTGTPLRYMYYYYYYYYYLSSLCISYLRERSCYSCLFSR